MALTEQEEKETRLELAASGYVLKRLAMRRREIEHQLDAINKEIEFAMKDREDINRKLIDIKIIPTGVSGIPKPERKDVPKKNLDVNAMSDEEAQALLEALIGRMT